VQLFARKPVAITGDTPAIDAAGSAVGKASMHRRLSLLSGNATRAGRRQALWLPVAGALMLCFLTVLAYAVWWLYAMALPYFTATSPAAGSSSSLFSFIFPAIMLWNILSTLPRCIWLIARGAALFDQQYASIWRLLERTNFAVLLADETYWELLQRNLALPLQRRVGSALGRRQIERQLETAAAFRLAFEDLQRGAQALRRTSLVRGTRALGLAQASRYTLLLMLFSAAVVAVPLWLGIFGSGVGGSSSVIALLTFTLPFAIVLIILVSLTTHNGPLLVQYRATLAALCDHLLLDRDEAASLLAQLPAPLHTPHWLQALEDWWLNLEERIMRLLHGPLSN
jgi:hypothetical protein